MKKSTKWIFGIVAAIIVISIASTCGNDTDKKQENTQPQQVTENVNSQNFVEPANETNMETGFESNTESEQVELPELDLKGVFEEEIQSEPEKISEAVQQRLYEMDELPEENQPEPDATIPETVNMSFQQQNDFSFVLGTLFEDVYGVRLKFGSSRFVPRSILLQT